jgi:hypothetical protein
MRTARNIAIIALLAVPIAFVPGGGDAADGILTAITLAFLATIGFAGYQLYRRDQLTFLGLDDRSRAILYGAVGLIVLMIAGADELLDTGLGALVWIGALAGAGFAIFRIWTEAHSY